MLISRDCPWASMNRGGCTFGGSKTGAVHGQKKGRGVVVSQLLPKLKESVTRGGGGARVVRAEGIGRAAKVRAYGVGRAGASRVEGVGRAGVVRTEG